MRIRKDNPIPDQAVENDVMQAAKIADALSHPARIRMLHFILKANTARTTVTNKDIVQAFEYSQATISQHLSKMIIGGLIETKKQGTSTCYFVKVGTLVTYTNTILNTK